MSEVRGTGTESPVSVTRLLAAGSADLASHLVTFGARPAAPSPGLLTSELRAAGLGGMGGAAFPAWKKLEAIEAAQRRSAPVVIGNGAEGEPLSHKDAVLLRDAPHLVIDGLLLLAEVVHAREVFLYATAPLLACAERAVSERRDARAIRLRAAPDTFISGESSAVVSALEGGPSVPRDNVQRLTTAGYRGRPTLVQNVETIAQIALIARYGAEWFRKAGTAEDPGSRLVTVSRSSSAGVVLEVAGGSRIEDVLRAAGTDPADAQAVLVGGYHGAWVPAGAFDLRLSAAAMARYGARPGAGIVMALERGVCPLWVGAGIARYLADQSARQCGPCANGLPAMARVLERITSGERTPALKQEAARLAGLVASRGSCNHPDGASRFVLSTLSVFDDDVRAHLSGRCVKR